ncbi:MAG: hypothetical protein DSZ32_02475 [Gammaproteobacteria bacterium]|nr:MAG: hypothetical protein DSZ32_02475 [Gammaproteobacteria bacterium]
MMTRATIQNKQPELFSYTSDELGEGAIWHAGRQSLFWLDIPKHRLYEKRFDSAGVKPDAAWDLPEMASALAVDEGGNDQLWMITDRSFGCFSLTSGAYQPAIQLGLPANLRANDGSVAPDGTFWFGTMEREPTGLHGSVYRITRQGKLSLQLSGIGIPNTFCWSGAQPTLYLSDSYRQKILAYECENGHIDQSSASLFRDLTGSSVTPDGGAIDENGNLWNCLWDGHCVAGYTAGGDLIENIALPTPRPTSCCFGGPDLAHLFITSAEGGRKQHAGEQLLPGAVFRVELPFAGCKIRSFSMAGN